MKNYFLMLIILLGFMLSYKVFADDEVADKPDPSFIGDVSNSMVNEAAQEENVQKDTDKSFVDDGNTNAQNSYFAGQSYQQQVGNATDKAFAGDPNFVGNDYGR